MSRLRVFCVLTALAVVAGPPAAAQAPPGAPVVAAVELDGNRFLDKATLLYYVSTKPGDRYDELRIKEDFRRLWDTGFLDDLKVEALDAPAGKVVVFHVLERKRIQIVDYRGSKALTKSNIEDRLKERDALLKIDSFYDINKARRIEGILREMLAEKGRPFGKVTHEERTLGGASTQVTFTIDDGPKASVKEITFAGNEVFSDGKLRGRMKKIKQGGFWNLSWLGGKRTYTEQKWAGGEEDEGDRSRLQQFYLDHGYVTANVGEPRITYADDPGSVGSKKPKKWMYIEIPITEGEQYRVGDVKFDGLTVFKEELVRPLFKLETGEVYRESKIRKGYEKLRDIYGSAGYFQWTALTERHPDPERKVVDITLKMEEDKRYYVGRINFTGNDSTRDKVIRREVYLTEGDVFNTELLKASIRRINQLGYFKPLEGAPELAQSDLGEDKLDVTLKIEEQNRNTFTFGGGVSGLEGTFVNASFSTANFLGLGETFQVSAQSGRRTKVYQLAITEPYLFDRPITAGIDLYRRRLELQTFRDENVQGYIDDRTGLGLVFGLPVGRWTRFFNNYSFEKVKIELTDAFVTDQGFVDPTRPLVNPLYLEDEGTRKVSKITPSLVFNTVDNPWTPRSGLKVSGILQVAGGPLRGTVDYFKPRAEIIWYIPHTRRTALGLHLDAAWLRPYGDTAEIDPETGRNGIPFYERYYLGGENQIRGYNIRSVGPRNDDGQLLGGNKYVVFNAEYYIDIGGPLRFLFFFDAGQTFREGEKFDFHQLRTSTGAEFRFLMPVLNVPFRLIYAFNPNRDSFQPKSTFKFAVGTTF